MDKKILLEEVKRLKEYFRFNNGFICNHISKDLPYGYYDYIRDWLWERKTMSTNRREGSYFYNSRERCEVLGIFERELGLEIREEIMLIL
jgi:hypothetical protein